MAAALRPFRAGGAAPPGCRSLDLRGELLEEGLESFCLLFLLDIQRLETPLGLAVTYDPVLIELDGVPEVPQRPKGDACRPHQQIQTNGLPVCPRFPQEAAQGAGPCGDVGSYVVSSLRARYRAMGNYAEMDRPPPAGVQEQPFPIM